MFQITIIDTMAPYLLTLILFGASVMIPYLFHIKNPRVYLLMFALLNILFNSITGAFGIAMAVLSIVLFVFLQSRESRSDV